MSARFSGPVVVVVWVAPSSGGAWGSRVGRGSPHGAHAPIHDCHIWVSSEILVGPYLDPWILARLQGPKGLTVLGLGCGPMAHVPFLGPWTSRNSESSPESIPRCPLGPKGGSPPYPICLGRRTKLVDKGRVPLCIQGVQGQQHMGPFPCLTQKSQLMCTLVARRSSMDPYSSLYRFLAVEMLESKNS